MSFPTFWVEKMDKDKKDKWEKNSFNAWDVLFYSWPGYIFSPLGGSSTIYLDFWLMHVACKLSSEAIMAFELWLLPQVESLAVQLTQREGELIQEKSEVKKLASFLKQVI